jgi:hypothetical protein
MTANDYTYLFADLSAAKNLYYMYTSQFSALSVGYGTTSATSAMSDNAYDY